MKPLCKSPLLPVRSPGYLGGRDCFIVEGFHGVVDGGMVGGSPFRWELFRLGALGTGTSCVSFLGPADRLLRSHEEAASGYLLVLWTRHDEITALPRRGR